MVWPKLVDYMPNDPIDSTMYYVRSLRKAYIYKKDDGFIEIYSDASLYHNKVLNNYRDIRRRDCINLKITDYYIVAYKVDLPKSAYMGHLYYCSQTNEIYVGAGIGNPLVLASPVKSKLRKCIDWIKAKIRKWSDK